MLDDVPVSPDDCVEGAWEVRKRDGLRFVSVRECDDIVHGFDSMSCQLLGESLCSAIRAWQVLSERI